MKRLLFAALLVVLSVSAARAELYQFYAITSNDSSGYAQFVGESQLFMEITQIGGGMFSLVFTNASSAQSVVSTIYFDYTPEINLDLISINDGSGVAFTSGRVNPGNLPAGQSLAFAFNSDLGVAANNPSPHNGINPSDSLELILDYDGTESFITALNNESVRVGMHVISLGEYSESFVNVVPEPATFSMALSSVAFSCGSSESANPDVAKNGTAISLPILKKLKLMNSAG
ncbi:MAG: hypothetical protein V3V05_13240 [Pontiella sp.]